MLGFSSTKVIVEWLILLLRVQEARFQISASTPAILTKDLCGFLQSLQANARIVS
jgi:hypothetical protein